MAAILTLLIPNYNRPAALGRLLKSVFSAIKLAAAAEQVEVAVIDDFSSEDPMDVVRPFMNLTNFLFRRQSAKCGNAELAFLSALEWVTTDYVWLLGNDDRILDDGIKAVLHLLNGHANPGFILLNPSISREKDGRHHVPITATSDLVRYATTEDLFMDFGFCTSTTTFPCLIMNTQPVRDFHQAHRLTQFATVYSHSFTIFGALRSQPAMFLSKPIVSFTHNERDEEQRKLWAQSPNGIMFYHHTLGLARLIRESAHVTAVPIAQFGSAIEDEVNKNDLTVHSTYLSHFLTMFFLEQLLREQLNVITPQKGFGHLVRAELQEVSDVVARFGDQALSILCANALQVFCWQARSAQWKHDYLRHAQDELRQLINEKRREDARSAPAFGPKKVAIASHVLSPLRAMVDNEGNLGTPLIWPAPPQID